MLGNAGKKLGRLLDVAEDLYERMNELRERVEDLHETVDDTNDRVATLEEEAERQRRLLEALAEEHGIDPAAVGEQDSAPDPGRERDATTDGAGE